VGAAARCTSVAAVSSEDVAVFGSKTVYLYYVFDDISLADKMCIYLKTVICRLNTPTSSDVSCDWNTYVFIIL
jgi:hypothetical protein